MSLFDLNEVLKVGLSAAVSHRALMNPLPSLDQEGTNPHFSG